MIDTYIIIADFMSFALCKKYHYYQSYFTFLFINLFSITKKDNQYLLEATVQNSEQFLWWVLSYREQVEVIKPSSLRNRMIKIVKKMNKKYQNK